MSEIVLSSTVDVPCAAEQVWAVLADYGKDPAWRTGVLAMKPSPSGPIAAGVTTEEVIRVGGRNYRNDGIVTSVGPDLAFTWRTTKGVDADGRRAVTPLGPDACRVRVDQRIRPHGTQRLLAPFLRPVLRRNLDSDLLRLRHLVAKA